MPQKKIQWGQLDMIARLLEDMVPEYAEIWNSGEVRMRPEDCKRLASYLGRIRISSSKMRDTLKLFEALAKQPGAQIIISNAISHEKNLQHQTA